MKRERVFASIVLGIVLMLGMPVCSNAVTKKPSISRKNVTLVVGEKVNLSIKKNKKKVVWRSSNKKVAVVSRKGVVKARKKGTATITATVSKKNYKCKVVVQAKAEKVTQNQVNQDVFENTTSHSTSASTTQNAASKQTTTKETTTTQKAAGTSSTTAVKPDVMDPETKDDGWIPGWY